MMLLLCIALAVVALICHQKKERHSPERNIPRGSSGPLIEPHDEFMTYEFFFALKWFALGVMATIAVMYWNTPL
jgi:hypothetical protein